MPLVSFIIPFYKVAPELLIECIQSIIGVTRADEREIIVVDDGNELPASEILAGIANQIKIIRQENSGLSVARNTGTENSTGTYIQYVDADDYLCSDYAKCIELLQKEQPDILFFHTTRKHGLFTLNRTKRYKQGAEYMLRNNLRGSACGFVFRKKCLGKLRFTPDRLHEDEEFTPQLTLQCDKTIETQFKAYGYRVREGSITNTASDEYITRRLDNIESIILNLANIRLKGSLEQKAMKRRIRQLTMDYMYLTAMLTNSQKQTKERWNTLKEKEIVPLPLKPYSWKYLFFAIISRLL